MQNIPVSKLIHSSLNVLIRDRDTSPIKNKKGETVENPKIKIQRDELTLDILRGMPLMQTPGTIDGKNNPALGWQAGSTFIVEPAQDGSEFYETLSGRHRLDLIKNWIFEIRDAAKRTKDAVESQRLTTLAESWEAFQILCDVRHPKDDIERRGIIAEGNPDENKKAKIPQEYPSRFEGLYYRVPAGSFNCHWTKGAEPKAEFDDGGEGWSNGKFQAETGIRGNFHTTYHCLAILGRHFDIPVEFFMRGNRLRIKQQVTQAILKKETPLGEPKTNAVTNVFGEGFIVRYKEARASARGTEKGTLAQALSQIKDTFKEEFVTSIMDGTMDELEANYKPNGNEGVEALGNSPEKSETEKKAEADAKEAERKEETDAATERTAATQTHRFEGEALMRALGHPNAPKIAPHIGAMFDLFLTLDASRFESCAKSLAAWKEANAKSKPEAGELAEIAFEEVADVITATAIEMDAKRTVAPASETVAPEMKEAAHATPNTAKSKKAKNVK